MWRTLIAATIVYVCGHPALNHFRPAFLNKPLQGFYTDVNLTAQEGRHVLSTLGNSRAVHYLCSSVAFVSSKLLSDK
jgi:hypothetical protein